LKARGGREGKREKETERERERLFGKENYFKNTERKRSD
jgi:hypothetical protein